MLLHLKFTHNQGLSHEYKQYTDSTYNFEKVISYIFDKLHYDSSVW